MWKNMKFNLCFFRVFWGVLQQLWAIDSFINLDHTTCVIHFSATNGWKLWADFMSNSIATMHIILGIWHWCKGAFTEIAAFPNRFRGPRHLNRSIWKCGKNMEINSQRLGTMAVTRGKLSWVVHQSEKGLTVWHNDWLIKLNFLTSISKSMLHIVRGFSLGKITDKQSPSLIINDSPISKFHFS